MERKGMERKWKGKKLKGMEWKGVAKEWKGQERKQFGPKGNE